MRFEGGEVGGGGGEGGPEEWVVVGEEGEEDSEEEGCCCAEEGVSQVREGERGLTADDEEGGKGEIGHGCGVSHGEVRGVGRGGRRSGELIVAVWCCQSLLRYCRMHWE